ncbi:uncharacterized protein DKFZp434B061-like [Mesoplodon densirostris]|uniref:uncharacterized protein DKFZp434B061-like n=1 Tax=Mesoplodon densirostris TaxID=48708 RepID=UPI0028DCC90D|nr:uncharacterized protein DKFZp434B061-like [Mesoplodon densirostris]
MWPARCPTAARPGGGGRRRGPVTSRVWQLPRPRRPAPDSRLAAPRPGRPNRPWSGPGPARRCRDPGSSPRGRNRRNRSRPTPACLPPRSPPRTLTRGSPESQFETEGIARCCPQLCWIFRPPRPGPLLHTNSRWSSRGGFTARAPRPRISPCSKTCSPRCPPPHATATDRINPGGDRSRNTGAINIPVRRAGRHSSRAAPPHPPSSEPSTSGHRCAAGCSPSWEGRAPSVAEAWLPFPRPRPPDCLT